MTKQKSTKRALLASALALLMCVSMLIGSTFAWFTDSVTSSGNKIVAGTLDIQLLMDGDVDGTYDDISNSTSPIFGSSSLIAQNNNADTLWEPGKTQVAYLAIKNNGNLALKYTVGLNVQNVSKDLYKVMEYAIVPNADANNKVTAWNGGNSVVVGTQSVSGDVSLAKGATHYFALVIHMDEEAGNEYQGGEVNFDLTVLATQDTVEYDSFDNQYDKDAIFYDKLVTTDAELKAAVQDPNVKTIAIKGDLTYDWGDVTDGANALKGITLVGYNGTDDSITFKGLGAANDIPNVNLKNITVSDSTISATENNWEYTYLEFNALTANNVVFESGILLKGYSTLTNCSVNSNANEYGVWILDGNATLNNCTFTGDRGVKIHEQYNTGDHVNDVETVVIDGCVFNSLTQKPGVAIDSLNTQITIKNSTFINCQAGDQDEYIYETDNTVPTLEKNTVLNDATFVSTTAELKDAIKNAPVNKETVIFLAAGTYDGDIDITLAAMGQQGGDVVIKPMGGKVILTGTVTLGYREQTVGATMYNANVTFEGITFDHAAAANHSLDVQDVKSLTLKNCTIIGDGEYGISSARGNGTGTSEIVGCTFENAGMQLLGNFATGLVIDDCVFNESCINVQAGNGVTVQNCEFNKTLTAANVGESFYAIRSNSTPITVKNCEINIDSELTEVATAQEKWGILWNRGTTNWTVENVEVTLTDAAQVQTELLVTKCTSTGTINTTNLTVNGVQQ